MKEQSQWNKINGHEGIGLGYKLGEGNLRKMRDMTNINKSNLDEVAFLMKKDTSYKEKMNEEPVGTK